MPAPKKLSAATAVLLPLLIHGLIAALKPLVHVGVTAAAEPIGAAFDEAAPYFEEAATEADREALLGLFARLLGLPSS